MALKHLFAASLGAALICASASMAADYSSDEFFGLDLSKAVMSPKPLGPPATFEPVPVEAKSDRASEPASARDELKTEPRKVAVETAKARHRRHVAAAVSQKSKASGRTHLAHRHRNPLDAQAMDTRTRPGPCKSGGICNWRQ